MPAVLLVCLLELVERSHDHALLQKVESLLKGLLRLLVRWASVFLLLGHQWHQQGDKREHDPKHIACCLRKRNLRAPNAIIFVAAAIEI